MNSRKTANNANKIETRYPGELAFHYNREERLQSLSPEVMSRLEGRKSTGLFKKNRTLMIILLDVLVIIFLYFLLMPFLNKRAQTAELAGYEMKLRAFLYENTTFVSLRITNPGTEAEEEGEMVSVRFYLEDAETDVEVIDILPAEGEEERILRTQLEGGKKKKRVYAEVRIRGETETLRTDIIPEQG